MRPARRDRRCGSNHRRQDGKAKAGRNRTQLPVSGCDVYSAISSGEWYGPAGYSHEDQNASGGRAVFRYRRIGPDSDQANISARTGSHAIGVLCPESKLESVLTEVLLVLEAVRGRLWRKSRRDVN